MSIMIPSCNTHAYMKFSKKNFAPYAKNATVKNIMRINKYNVGMKSLDRAIIVSDTLKTETSPSFISQALVPVLVPVLFPAPVPDSGFWLFHRPLCIVHSAFSILQKTPTTKSMNLFNLLLGSKTFEILNYPLPLWDFSGIMKQINLNGKTRLKIPSGSRQTSGL